MLSFHKACSHYARKGARVRLAAEAKGMTLDFLVQKKSMLK